MYWFHFGGCGMDGVIGRRLGMFGGRFGVGVLGAFGGSVYAFAAFFASRRRLFGLPVVLAYVWYGVVVSVIGVVAGGCVVGGANVGRLVTGG
jgi:hypothetical protein